MSRIDDQLLRMLEASSARSAAASARPADLSATGGIDFQELLKKARSGEGSSGLPVTLAKGAGVDLNPDQMTRLAAAADKAQAQGATRALVMIDGMALKLDVTMREITGTADLASGGVLTGIDAVLQVGGGAAPGAPVTLKPPPAGTGSASLLKTLADRERTDAA